MISSIIPVLVLILSTLVAWLLVPVENSFPLIPFIIFFSGLSTLVFFVRKNRNWFDTVLYFGILGLAGFLFVRANEVTQFITFISIFVFGSLLILPPAAHHPLPTLLLTPFFTLIEALTGRNRYPYKWDFVKKYSQSGAVKSHLLSVIVTLLFLLITVPLLASANPYFNQLLRSILNFFNLTQFFRYLSEKLIMINIFRIFVLFALSYTIPRVLTASAGGAKLNSINISMPVNYLIPKVAMAILLVIFFITQAQLYFATSEVLQSMGYTNSRLANEVFTQVTIVAFVIFFLVYLDKHRSRWHQHLTYFLILEAFFLVGMAFKSVFDYSYLWGFTRKRLWGFAAMSWLTGALLIFLYYYQKQTAFLSFFRHLVTLTVVMLLAVNLANFDYMISHYSFARTQSGTDYVYLSKLSPDAGSYPETLNNLVSQIDQSDTPEPEKIHATLNLLNKIDYLKQKYHARIPLNSFNLSEYQEYLRVVDIDTRKYRILPFFTGL